MADRALVAEALVCLVLASAALRLTTFGDLARWASGRDDSDGRPAEPARARRVARAVMSAARRAPWAPACFAQGLACHAMLRRRGLPSRLYYGARNDGSRGLQAHVWVCVGEVGLVGAETAGDFALLATFPSFEAAPAAMGEGR
jgi:hypothetical protein